ncbi:MAG: hypothetical protein ACLTCI_09855 [[Clostridium] nexile]
MVTPDNGTLTFLHDMIGVEEIREIDEKTNRYQKTKNVSVFHGETYSRIVRQNWQQERLHMKRSDQSIQWRKLYCTNSIMQKSLPVM